jgi:hypothetical protein
MQQNKSLWLKGHLFRFRAPSRAELRRLKNFAGRNHYEFQEQLLTHCVVDPPLCFDDTQPALGPGGEVNLARLPFLLGDIKQLSEAILRATGMYDGPELTELVQQASDYVQTEEGRLDMLTLITIPGQSYNQLQELEPEDQFKVWAAAQSLAPVLGIDSRMVLDPESWEAEQHKKLEAQRRKNLHAQAQARLNTGRRGAQAHPTEVESEQSFSLG